MIRSQSKIRAHSKEDKHKENLIKGYHNQIASTTNRKSWKPPRTNRHSVLGNENDARRKTMEQLLLSDKTEPLSTYNSILKYSTKILF